MQILGRAQCIVDDSDVECLLSVETDEQFLVIEADGVLTQVPLTELWDFLVAAQVRPSLEYLQFLDRESEPPAQPCDQGGAE